MPKFSYRAKQGPTKVVNGTIEAATLEDAVEKLDVLGLLPIHLEEAAHGASVTTAPAAAFGAPEAAPSAPAAKGIRLFAGGVRSSDLTMFGRQLSSLIKSGVPILKALWIISDQTSSERFKQFLNHAQDEIRNGKTLSSVLAAYPKLFPPIYIAMVRAGEDSGTLQETLLRVSDYRKRQEEVMSKVRAAMAYPALMLMTGIGTIIFMMAFVIPRLTSLFTSMGGALPLPTRILMKASNFLRQPAFWVAGGGIAFAVILFVRLKPQLIRVLWSHASLRIPLIKDFVLKSELARFARTLELLIHSGIPILKALEITTPVVSNVVLSGILVKMHADVTGGGSLGKGLRNSKFFPVFMTNMIAVGEESGNLEGSLGEIASYYDAQTEEMIKVMTSLMEPLMILVMGLVVGFIVIAMMLPMFELNMMVK